MSEKEEAITAAQEGKFRATLTMERAIWQRDWALRQAREVTRSMRFNMVLICIYAVMGLAYVALVVAQVWEPHYLWYSLIWVGFVAVFLILRTMQRRTRRMHQENAASFDDAVENAGRAIENYNKAIENWNAIK